MPEKALDVFDGVSSEANNVLYTIVFSACADLSNDGAVQSGKRILAQMPSSMLNDALLVSSAIHMLMKFGDVSHAERLFQKLKKKGTVIYGAMMNGKRVSSDQIRGRSTALL